MFRLLSSERRQSVFLRAVVALIRDLHPDWIVDEVAVDDGAWEALPRLEHIESQRWIAILPNDEAVVAAAEALVAGASGIITGSSSVREAEEALQTALADGPVYVPTALARALAASAIDPRRDGKQKQWVRLSAREREVLELLARGLSNSEIANRLSISVNTVRTHLQAVSSKLNVSGRAGLAAAAWRHGLAGEANPPEQSHARAAEQK